MAILENAKHEAFARALSKGMSQKKAYVHAGYSANDSAASRLASSPDVQARVGELKEEVHQKINKALAEPNEENFQSLADMGLTMEWCANAFKNIYETALDQGQLAPANTAVSNIQKLIEINGAGTGETEDNPESLIKVSEVTDMLDSLKGVIDAAKGPEEIRDPADTARDVTPAGITKQIEGISYVDDHDAGTG